MRRGWLPARLPAGVSAFSHLLPQQVWSCEAPELPLVEGTRLTPALGHCVAPALGGQEFSAESVPLLFAMFALPRMKLEVWLQGWVCWAYVPAFALSWGFAYKAWQGPGTHCPGSPVLPSTAQGSFLPAVHGLRVPARG